MNNWGVKAAKYWNSRAWRRNSVQRRLTQVAQRRRALIDDEDACPDTAAARHGRMNTSLDGFCREQILTIDTRWNAAVARVRAAQMAHNEEGWDDDIPRTPQYRCRISR